MSDQLEIQYPKKFVVKSNRMVRARTELTKLEHQVVAGLIAELKKQDTEFDVVTIQVKDLIRKAGTASQEFYNRGKEICQGLLDQKIEVQRTDEDGNRTYRGVNLFSMCEYEEGRGAIKARFTEDMRPFLLQLKNRFTMYLLQFFLRLDRKHSMRIYELLKMMEFVSVLKISVEELREVLGLLDKYNSFSHLKKHVIETAREEIAEKTDIRFTYHVERDGRTPVRVKFYIHEKEQVDTAVPPPEDQFEKENGDLVDYDSGDRTEMHLSVKDMFLSELSQEQIAEVSDSKLEEMEARAIKRSQELNSGRSWSVVASNALPIMKTIWAEEVA